MSELLDPTILNALDKHDSNMVWYRNNYLALKQNHAGQLILIIDRDKQPEFFQDISQLKERLKKGDIDTRSIVIEYIADDDISIMT